MWLLGGAQKPLVGDLGQGDGMREEGKVQAEQENLLSHNFYPFNVYSTSPSNYPNKPADLAAAFHSAFPRCKRASETFSRE